MVQWLLPANSRSLTVLAALTLLGACATPSPAPHSESSTAGWRVIERVGEARYSPPDAATWLAAITGRPITEGSEVTTGPGGRLILAFAGRHISVGPDSRFLLPRPDRGDRLEQRSGWLRYRMADAIARPFRVHTRSLNLEFVAAVVDVRVDESTTEVTVREGEVRLATPDGLRRTEIAAGQSARSSGLAGAQLAVRGAPAQALEPVEPMIVPAVHPTPRPPADRLADRSLPNAHPDRGSSEVAPAEDTVETHLAGPPVLRPARAAAPSPAGSSSPTEASAESGANHSGEPAEAAWVSETSRPSVGRRGQFERLTEGMVGDLPPVRPQSLVR